MTVHDPRPLLEDDPDVVRINDMLDHRLSRQDYDDVIAKMATDPVFFAKAQLLIKVSTARVNWGALRERFAREDAAKAARPAPVAKVIPISRARRFTSARLYRAAGIAAAVVVLTAATPLYTVGVYIGDVTDATTLGTRDTQASDPSVGTFISTTQQEERLVAVSATSRVRLRGQSRLTYKRIADWPHGILATLKGEAVIEVSDADGAIFLGTMAGSVLLRPGVYAVRCELGCTTMRVTVGARGRAYVKGATWSMWIWLDPGQHGEVEYPENPYHTPGVDYPEVRP